MARTRQIDRTGQRSLFAGIQLVSDPAATAAPAPERAEVCAPDFRDPSPEGIVVVEQFLREFLEAGDEREVFWIREFLRRKIDLTAFEGRYRGAQPRKVGGKDSRLSAISCQPSASS